MRRLRPVLSCLFALLLTLSWSVAVAHCLRLRISPAGAAATTHHARHASAAHAAAGHDHVRHGDAAYYGATLAGLQGDQPPPDDGNPEDAPAHRLGGSICPACHILGATDLPVPPALQPRIAPIEMAAAPHPAGAPPARPRAPPQQPRAPPPTALA